MATLRLSKPMPAYYRREAVDRAHNDSRRSRNDSMAQRAFTLPSGPGDWSGRRWTWTPSLQGVHRGR